MTAALHQRTPAPPGSSVWYAGSTRMLSAILTAILPTFGIIGTGWCCRRFGIWKRESVRSLNSYAYVIALPALIFDAVFRLDLAASASRNDARFLLGLLGGHLLVFLLALPLVHRASRAVRATAPMLLVFGSTAYLGIPYATYAFGATGTAYAALGSVVLVITVLFASLLVLGAQGRRESPAATWHQLLELPFLWVVLAGILLPVLGVRTLPEFLSRTVDVLAGSAGPTALLAYGAFTFDLRLSAIPWRRALLLGAGKVVLPTVATYAVLSVLGVTGLHLAVGVALAATSIAITAFVLADEYRIGRELVAGSMLVSTFASLLALSGITILWIRGFFG